MEKFEPIKCEHCSQSVTYLLPIDRGTVDIVKAIAVAIKIKGINAIHPRKEIEGKSLTSNQVGNLSRPRFHGLIAKIEGEKGNYCLTRKGLEFLNGAMIPKYAIINKSTGSQEGYWNEDTFQVRMKDFTSDDEYWEGVGYEIVEGGIILSKDPNQPELI